MFNRRVYILRETGIDIYNWSNIGNEHNTINSYNKRGFLILEGILYLLNLNKKMIIHSEVHLTTLLKRITNV